MNYGAMHLKKLACYSLPILRRYAAYKGTRFPTKKFRENPNFTTPHLQGQKKTLQVANRPYRLQINYLYNKNSYNYNTFI